MSASTDRYPELTTLHHEFLRALTADPEPQRNAAYLWYQGIVFSRDAGNPSATARGHEGLRYLHVTQQGKTVPGQNFVKGQTPAEVLSGLISRNAADWDGPYQINFRYDRSSDGVWAGFYSIETSAQHRDIVAGRAAIDLRIAAALKAGWQPDIDERMLTYGSKGDDPGPKVIDTRKSGGSERIDP